MMPTFTLRCMGGPLFASEAPNPANCVGARIRLVSQCRDSVNGGLACRCPEKGGRFKNEHAPDGREAGRTISKLARPGQFAQRARLVFRRGSQVVRPGSAKPLCVGSIPTRASNSNCFRSTEFGVPRSATDTKTENKITTP